MKSEVENNCRQAVEDSRQMSDIENKMVIKHPNSIWAAAVARIGFIETIEYRG